MLDTPLAPTGPRPLGDPAAIRDLARLLRLNAASARRIGDSGGRALHRNPWQGNAATAARGRLRTWERRLDREAARLVGLAGRLDREADRLEAAQASWKRKADAR